MLAIGTYLSIRLGLALFGACQVIGHDGNVHWIAGIAYFGPKPTVDDLRGRPVLVIDHHHWQAHAQRLAASGAPSAEYEVIGVGEVEGSYAGPIDSSGSWEAHVASFRSQERWTHVPADQVAAFADARSAGYEKGIFRLAGGEKPVTRSLTRLAVGSHRVPATAGQTDWAALDRMGCLTQLESVGPDAAVLDFVRRRRVITAFRWAGHAQKVIDLSEARLIELTVDVIGGPLELLLGDCLEKLTLVGEPGGSVTVVHPRRGRHLALTLERIRNTPTTLAGLAELSTLSVSAPRELKLGALGYTKLTALRLQCDRWLDPEALTQFPELGSVQCDNVYRFDAGALPLKSELAALRAFTCEGVCKDAGATIKKRLKGSEVSVSGAKDPTWVDTALSNPFHDWTYTHELMGKDASAAYRGAAQALAKIAEGDAKTFDQRMAAFGQSMAKLAGAHDLDAQHKAQIRDAFRQLGAPSSRRATDPEVTAWLDRAGFQ